MDREAPASAENLGVAVESSCAPWSNRRAGASERFVDLAVN